MHLLIPAAGMGRRMGSDRNKLLLTLLGKPLLAWTLIAAEASDDLNWIGIISQPSDWGDIKDILAQVSLTKPVELITEAKPVRSQFTMDCKHYQMMLNEY